MFMFLFIIILFVFHLPAALHIFVSLHLMLIQKYSNHTDRLLHNSLKLLYLFQECLYFID